NENLLDGILGHALGYRSLVQKSPHRRSVSVVGDELLDLPQISSITSVDRAEHDARRKLFLRLPCLAYGARDHHTEGSLRPEITVEDEVLDLVGDGQIDRFFGRARIEQFRPRPALLNPRTDLRNRIARVIGDEDPQGLLGAVAVAFLQRSDPVA